MIGKLLVTCVPDIFTKTATTPFSLKLSATNVISSKHHVWEKKPAPELHTILFFSFPLPSQSLSLALSLNRGSMSYTNTTHGCPPICNYTTDLRHPSYYTPPSFLTWQPRTDSYDAFATSTDAFQREKKYYKAIEHVVQITFAGRQVENVPSAIIYVGAQRLFA